MKPKSRKTLKARLRGLSLVETMVASAILLMITLCAYQVLINAIQYFNTYQQAIEAQKAGMATLRQINDSLKTSTSTLVNCSADGVAFCSPYKNDGVMGFDLVVGSPTHGKLKWQKYACIYRDPATKKVWRKEEPISPPHVTPPSPNTAGKTVAYFKSLSGGGLLLGDDVNALNVTISAEPGKQSYDVTMLVGTQNDPGRFWLILRSHVTPEN